MKRLKIRLRIISSVLQDVITGRSKCGLFVSSVMLLHSARSLDVSFHFEQFVSSMCGGVLTTTIALLGSIGVGPFSHGFELLVLSGFSGEGVGCSVVKMLALPVKEVDIECSSKPLKNQLAAITKLRVSITSKKMMTLISQKLTIH